MIKRILSSKTRLGIAIIIILMLVMGLSYGTFLITTDNYKVSELLIAELNYGIEIIPDVNQTCTVNETRVTTPVDTECFVTIEISSVNSIDSRYILAYKNEQGSAEIKYTDKTQWKSEGVIEDFNNNYTRKIRIVLNNRGQNTESITDFKVYGGYKFNSNDSIKLKDGYTTIPGTYTESVEAGNKRLVDIVEKDTDCITKDSKECLYGGGTITNYLQYPTPADGNTNDNLWRITGSYSIDGTTYSKVVYNNNYVANTSKDNIQTTLINFYNTLDKASETIQNTNKFNCTKEGCTISAYDKIGLLSTYEYDAIGGQESYLGITDSWFALDNETVKNITPTGITEITGNSGIRPTAYLQTDVMVTGKGTIDDPYRINPKGDINLVAYTLDGKQTNKTFKELIDSKAINDIKCDKGTIGEWNYFDNTIKLSNVQIPDNCTINFKKEVLFVQKILKDNENITIRDNSTFNAAFETTGLYQEIDTNYLEEDGRKEDIVYYYTGNPTNNWVKFGKEDGTDIWWRIIRTNEDGSVRLLYVGKDKGEIPGHATTNGYINISTFNNETDSILYVGYKYGYGRGIQNHRKNNTDSQIKSIIDVWYENNLKNKYESYISKTAVYCNDRASDNYDDSYATNFAAYERALYHRPSFKCGNNEKGVLYSKATGAVDVADRFSVPNSMKVGNQQLDNPIALMTADEIVYAGGILQNPNSNAYYSLNSRNESVTGNNFWWTMSPCANYADFSAASVMTVVGTTGTNIGMLTSERVEKENAIRPVISLKSCVGVSGKGTTEDPYIPAITTSCAQADN